MIRIYHYNHSNEPENKLLPCRDLTLNNVASMSMRRHDVASTLRRRCFDIMCLLGMAQKCVIHRSFISLLYNETESLEHRQKEMQTPKQEYNLSKATSSLVISKIANFENTPGLQIRLHNWKLCFICLKQNISC